MEKFSIQEHINKVIADKNVDKPVRSWHPSALGSCLTGAYLNRMGVPADEAFSIETLRMFSVGKHFEEWIVGVLQETGLANKGQVRIDWPEYGVGGYADNMVEAVNNPLIYEIKSTNSRAFKWLKKTGAKQHHRMQLWTYLHCLNVDEGRLFYMDRDWLTFQEFIVLRNDKELEKAVIAELDILKRAWEQKLPPRPTFEDSDWRAKYCRFHKKCISQEKYLN